MTRRDFARPVQDAVERFYKAYNTHDAAHLEGLFCDDYVGTVNGNRVEGPAQARAFIEMFLRAFPDCVYLIHKQVPGKDRIAVEWSFSGTHQGPFLGLEPTGKRASGAGTTLFQLRGGQIQALTSQWDAVGLKARLQA